MRAFSRDWIWDYENQELFRTRTLSLYFHKSYSFSLMGRGWKETNADWYGISPAGRIQKDARLKWNQRRPINKTCRERKEERGRGEGRERGKKKKIIPQKNYCFVVREILESPTQTSIQASVLIVGLPLSVDKSLTSFRGHNPLNTKSTLQLGKKRNKSKDI